MKELIITSAQPSDLYFCWQLRVQCANFRKYGYSDKYHPLVWWHDRRLNQEAFQNEWDKLQDDYPEVTFHFYSDESGDLSEQIARSGYIPLLRPWLLMHHFKKFPELEEKAIFYIDSDIVFTQKLDFEPFLNDEVCYLSDTKSYIAASYFDSKIKDVAPDRMEDYKKIDVLERLTSGVGISRKMAENNELGSGGAQYLLKGINYKFWQRVFSNCLLIRKQLFMINETYFAGNNAQERENKGFQRWCADMWAVLWTLWLVGKETKCPTELDFAWATDLVEKWENVYIYHDAGASTRPIEEGHQLFHKREQRYIDNTITPLQEDLSFVSKKYCSSKYVECIEEAKEKPNKFLVDEMGLFPSIK